VYSLSDVTQVSVVSMWIYYGGIYKFFLYYCLALSAGLTCALLATCPRCHWRARDREVLIR